MDSLSSASSNKVVPFEMRTDSTLYGSRQTINPTISTALYLFNTCRSDMSIYVEKDGVSIPAHRLIVGAASAVLEAVVYGTGTLPGTDSLPERPTMTVKDCSAKHFHEVLRFIYTGKNNLTMESVVYIQMTAHFYDLKTLEENCLAFFDVNVQRSNVTEAFSDAHNLNSIVLKDKCIAMMKKHIPCMLQIYSMELSAIQEFFKKITFLDYKVVFQWLLIWAKKQPGYNDDNGKSLRTLVASRLDVVRFTKMKMPQFNECLEMAGPDFFLPAEIGSIVLQILHPIYTFKKYEEALSLALCND